MSTILSVEGGEGAGKTTLVRGLTEALQAEGHRVLSVREPGTTAFGEALRDLILKQVSPRLTADTELLLMFAARQRLLQEQVRPALDKGYTILYDRYLDSSYAYQVHAGGASEDLMHSCIQALDIPQPAMTLLLDLDPEKGMARHGRQPNEVDSFESRPVDFLRRVRQGFLLRAEQHPDRICVLDATQDARDLLSRALDLCLQSLSA